YMLYCKNERGNGAKSQARKTICIKRIYRYLANRAHKIDKNPLEELDSPKLSKSLPKYLTLDQSKRVLQNIDGMFKERNYAIVTLFLNCGLRLAELCSLNLRDIDFTDRIVVVTGKGNKQRQIFLNDACINAINEYLKVRKPSRPDEKALFVSKRGTRIGRRMVEQIITDLLNRSDLGGMGLSTHKLRHTAATLMHQYGNVDIRVLQEVLGHENLGTTEIYTHLSNEQVQRAVDSNPLSNLKQN
ncbi:MAG: tyrosine-type recombinase/integrase, partial [Acutalibacteraceae bacterium]|nr:tyrosine-type recombinase/integrase [Acutalibacteraceae bacterium]